jgi:FkbM family methyltransferase
MNLQKLRQLYLSGEIDKYTYVQLMYKEKHTNFFDYSRYLRNTNIKEILITDDSVIMTSRNRGVKAQLIEDDYRNHPLEILNFLSVENDEISMLEKLLIDGNTVLDIGANIGWHSINLALYNNSLAIYAFEPSPLTYKSLLKNLELNSIHNVKAFNYGFSSEPGEAEFYINKNISGNSSMKILSSNELNKVFCRFETIDIFQKKEGIKIDLIKCDVEGAELLVLQGGISTLNLFKPIVFAEILRKFSKQFLYDPNEIFNLFKNFGYCAFTLDRNFLKPFGTMNDETIETNFFFLHKEKHADLILRYRIN